MLTGSYRRCVRPEAAGTYLGDSSLALGGGSDREHLSGEVISSLGPEGSEVRIQPTCESWFQEMRWPNQEPVSGLWNLRVRQLVTKTEVTKKKTEVTDAWRKEDRRAGQPWWPHPASVMRNMNEEPRSRGRRWSKDWKKQGSHEEGLGPREEPTL